VTLNHIHLQVRDLNVASDWFETILQIHPGFRNERMATFAFDSFILIIEAASDDAPATVGFECDDCDRDFRAVVERGAIALEPPTNQEWGIRAAYFRGPGSLELEIEGPVANG